MAYFGLKTHVKANHPLQVKKITYTVIHKILAASITNHKHPTVFIQGLFPEGSF